jgi:hypothetical protein
VQVDIIIIATLVHDHIAEVHHSLKTSRANEITFLSPWHIFRGTIHNIGYTIPTFCHAYPQYSICYITNTENLLIYTSALTLHYVHAEQRKMEKMAGLTVESYSPSAQL